EIATASGSDDEERRRAEDEMTARAGRARFNVLGRVHALPCPFARLGVPGRTAEPNVPGEVASLKREMWQWRAPLPSRAARSRLLDGGAEPGKRVAQTFILDVAEAGGDARGRLRVERWGGLAGLAAERGLAQPQPADGLPAEEPVHPLEHDAGEQLDAARHRSPDA